MTADGDNEQLLERACAGDAAARQELLGLHRDRLRRMIALHLDRRLAARVDPSDVVQEALAEAAGRLDDYLRQRPLPYYPWLRQIAWERLLKVQRYHLRAQKRSVQREQPGVLELPDESALELARRLGPPGSTPSRKLLREELQSRVQSALARLEVLQDPSYCD